MSLHADVSASPAAVSPGPRTEKSTLPSSSVDPVESAFSRVRSALAAYQAMPDEPARWSEIRMALRDASVQIAQFPRRSVKEPKVEAARALIREVTVSGIHDTPATVEQLELAFRFSQESWPGLLAAMLLVPASQWSGAPALDAVPDWLWGDYTAWLFATPQGFCAIGQAELFAAHTLKRLGELNQWLDRNSGSSVVRSALDAYLKSSNCIPLYFSHQSLRTHAELRGRLLQRGYGKLAEPYDPLPAPREGRKLRVGFVNRHFGPQTETFTTLPTFEQLDPERFEVILFAHRANGTPLETYCREHAQEFYLFPADVAGQVSTLRAAALDVVVFGTNLTAVCNEVTLLALHRVAPLQVVNNSSCITSGMPEMDLYVSGDLTEIADASAHFTERLGLVPGPAHAFNYEADRQDPTTTWSRANLSIPEDALVFVSAANYFKIIPEMQHAWARLLAAVPGSFLVIHPFNPNWSSTYPIQRFCAEFDRVLKEYQVDGSRLVVSSARFPSRHDVKELLRIGDVYLDTYPFGGVNSLIDPLELGLPVVVWEGETFRSRMGGALLRSLHLESLIATTEAQYHAVTVNLARDKAVRERFSAEIQAKMERQPVFLDSLAASDAFGDLIEAAFDEIVVVGRAAFHAERTPLKVAQVAPLPLLSTDALDLARAALRQDPASPAARHAAGRALTERGHHARAIEYLLAAVQNDENNASLWFDLAVALRRTGQAQQAIQALEASLRLDQSQVEAWIMLAELAKNVGSHDLAREAASVVRTLSPNDPRIATYLHG